MKTVKGCCVSLIVTFLLAACAGAPQKLQSLPPDVKESSQIMISQSEMLESTNNMTKHLDKEKRILYYQPFGGGGAALGVLFGPIGVAANGAMIEANTNADVAAMYGKILVEPREIFSDVATQNGLSFSAIQNENSPRFTPYLYIPKLENGTLLVASALIIERGNGANRWRGKYMYQLPVSYSVAALSEPDENVNEQLRKAAAIGFGKLLRMIRNENQETLSQEQSITFHSDFLNPRFNFEGRGSLVANDTDIVWVRTIGGVFAIQKGNITMASDQTK
jgi:hypothetical protein